VKNPALCTICSKPVRGTWILTMNQKFHKNCFKCSVCNAELGDGKYTEIEGKIMCTAHQQKTEPKKNMETVEKTKETQKIINSNENNIPNSIVNVTKTEQSKTTVSSSSSTSICPKW
jgi:hypothetical protein